MWPELISVWLQTDETVDEVAGLLNGGVEAVVDHDFIELRSAAELVGGTVYAHVDDFGCLGAAEFKTSAQFVEARRLYEYRQGFRSIHVLDMQGAVYVEVQDYVVALAGYAVDLAAECAVEAAWVNFFVFKKFTLRLWRRGSLLRS